MKQTYWLDPRDKPGLLIALMRLLAGNSHIALEGDPDDMAEMDFTSIPGVKGGIIAPFKNEWDKNAKVVVLPLENDTIPLILHQVLPKVV